MTLSNSEYSRLQFLLGKQQSGMLLTPAEQAELRQLVVHQNPAAQGADWDAIIKIGLVALGAYLLLRLLSDE